MGEIIKLDKREKDEVLEIMNDVSLCPALEESGHRVSSYTKLSVSRLAALGTAFQPLATAIQTATTGTGGSGLYYVNTGGKTMFQMKGTRTILAL